MAFTKSKNIPGLLIHIEFERAFDSFSWQFIYKIFNYYGFGKSIKSWVKLLNTNLRASILQCGYLSEHFKVHRGCIREDPIALYLFLLCAEILAMIIKQNVNIKGIVINSKEYKITQYAE